MITCLPIVTAQGSLISLKPLELKSSSYFRETSVVFKNGINNETMLHACPLLNSIVFEAFNVTYAIWFLVSCLRVCLYWSIRVCGFRFMRWNSGFWYLCPTDCVLVVVGAVETDKEAYGVISLAMFLAIFRRLTLYSRMANDIHVCLLFVLSESIFL